MAAGRFQHGRTTPAVGLTRPRMAWTPRPKRYGTPPRIRPPAPCRTMSRKRRCSTGPIWRRKSDGKEATPDRRNANRGASGRAWPVGALAIGHQPLPCLPHSCWGLVRVLSHLMEPADQGGSLIHLCHRKSDHRRCVFRKGMPAAARIPLAIGSHPP